MIETDLDKFRLRVLFTGRNNIVANNLAKQVGEEYSCDILQCNGTKEALSSTVGNGRPHVVIVCLNKGETRGTVWLYDMLNKYVEIGRMCVIVAGNEEDNITFRRYTELAKVTFMRRPVNMCALLDKLKLIEDDVIRSMNNKLEFVEEYIREPDKITRKRILVVDDDMLQLMFMRDQLAEFYEVTVANSGDAARKALKYGRIDLIFLDYIMPNEDGPSLLKSFRENPVTANIPVVFLTGMTDRDTVLNIINNLKPQGYLVKPASKADLVCKVIEVLG